MAKGISVLLILGIFAALAVSSQQAGLAQQPVRGRKQVRFWELQVDGLVQ